MSVSVRRCEMGQTPATGPSVCEPLTEIMFIVALTHNAKSMW